MKTGHGVCFLPITLKKELVGASLMQALACSRCLSKLSQPGKKLMAAFQDGAALE